MPIRAFFSICCVIKPSFNVLGGYFYVLLNFVASSLVAEFGQNAVTQDLVFLSQVRQCISHLWNIIVKSSLSTAGVAQEVVNCEQQVFAKKL